MAFVSTTIDIKDLLRKLDALSARMRGTILRKAITKAGQVVHRAEKSGVAVDEGWLKKSLGTKVKIYRKGGVAVVMIGPRTGFTTSGRGKKKRKVQTKLGEQLDAAGRKPTNYAHLVEKGTKVRISKSGKSSGRMPAKPFVKPALMRSRAAVQHALQSTIAAELAKRL